MVVAVSDQGVMDEVGRLMDNLRDRLDHEGITLHNKAFLLGLEKQLLTMSVKKMIEEINPHIHVHNGYVDSLLLTSNIHIKSLVNELMIYITLRYGSFFIGLNNMKYIFLDVCKMNTDAYYIIIEEV